MGDKIDISAEAVKRHTSYDIMMSLDNCALIPSPDGTWVSYSDYAALSARLAEVESLARGQEEQLEIQGNTIIRINALSAAAEQRGYASAMEAERKLHEDRIEELENILSSSPCEIAAHSNSLTEYMFHWEGRAMDAEAKLAATPSPDALIRAALEAAVEHHKTEARFCGDIGATDKYLMHKQAIREIHAIADDPEAIARIIKAAEGRG